MMVGKQNLNDPSDILNYKRAEIFILSTYQRVSLAYEYFLPFALVEAVITGCPSSLMTYGLTHLEAFRRSRPAIFNTIKKEMAVRN